jgi:hypothetical protein
VSVDGDSIKLNQHWGSLYTMEDYTSKAHNVYLSANFVPSNRVRISGMFSYNKSTAGLDPVEMPDPEPLLDDYEGHQDFTFTEMHTYSDIDYKILRLSAGVQYLLAPGIMLTVDGELADLTDDSGGYIYGVESGSYFFFRTGVQIEM